MSLAAAKDLVWGPAPSQPGCEGAGPQTTKDQQRRLQRQKKLRKCRANNNKPDGIIILVNAGIAMTIVYLCRVH